MSGKWFSNRGQVMQILIAFVALLVGILVAFPHLPVQQGFQGFLSAWPIIIFPLVALALMWLNNQRMHQAIETLVQQTPQVSAPAVIDTELVKSRVPYADLFPRPAEEPKDGWRITDIYVVEPRVKVGSYWDDPIAKTKLRISVVAIHEEPGRRSAELAIGTGGSIVYGGSESEQVGTNRYKVTISGSGFNAEERSIHQFSFDDQHIHFFAIRVDGLDTALNEVALQIATLRVWMPKK